MQKANVVLRLLREDATPHSWIARLDAEFFAGPIASDRIREFQENRGRPLIDQGSTNESSASRAGTV
jgi:hypothetical protein